MKYSNLILLAAAIIASASIAAQAAEKTVHPPATGTISSGSTFAAITREKSLAPGIPLEYKDRNELRLRPGLEIICRFRLNDLKPDVQNLTVKNGEYILRVNRQDEGGNLAFFVQVEGKWESRLMGPVIKKAIWYDVHAIWTGQEMTMDVNGQCFSAPRQGRISPGTEPLQIGAIAGIIELLEIQSPSLERIALLEALPKVNPAPPRKPGWFKVIWNSLLRRSSPTEPPPGQSVLGVGSSWDGWQAHNGASMGTGDDTLTATFSTSAAMLVSPTLPMDLVTYPFICIDFESAPPGCIGYLDIITETGTGTLCFEPQSGGRPTVISGMLSDAWTGKLRRISLSFNGGTEQIRIRKIVLADHPVGTPSFYIRSLAAGRAKLRPEREESVVAGILNVGGEAENISASLSVPRGVRIIGSKKQTVPYLGMDDFDMTTWRIQAARPGEYTVRVTVSSDGAERFTKDLTLVVEPLPDLPETDYVLKPRPAKTDYINLMHYCALWKEGTHYGWKKIEPWPERRPAIGWYDEGTPEVADWHIKYALEHGINGFIYCWYRADYEPQITHTLGHAIHEGLFNAKYRDLFNFTIMWENGCAKGVKDEADLLDNVLPFWIKNYFTHPSYLKIDNKPVLFVWQPRQLIPQLGGPEGTKRAFDKMREQCRKAGFAGLRIIACMDAAETRLGAEIAASGWDAVSGYGLRPAGVVTVGEDAAGLAYRDHADVLSRFKQTWQDRDTSTGDVPDIPNVVMGWDTRPWGRVKPGIGSYIADPEAANFEAACRDAKELVDAKPAGRWDSRMVVFDNWTEFGEGHYIEPTTGTGFTFVNAIKRVFCTDWAPESVTDIIPEDLGLPPPQQRYEEVRAGFGNRMPWQPIRITGDLLAQWEFETEEDGHFADSSPNDCRLRNEGVSIVSGRGGKVLQCGEGGAITSASAPFFNPGGITVSLWCRPTEKGQSDRWMLNTVSGGTDGYRLGLGSGRPVWQVPRESWSHGLNGPDPLPVNEWSHIAATFDNQVMRLYINGKEVGNLERRGFINPGSSITIGGYSTEMDRARFRGQLDSVRVYRRVLSAEEIAALATE